MIRSSQRPCSSSTFIRNCENCTFWVWNRRVLETPIWRVMEQATEENCLRFRNFGQLKVLSCNHIIYIYIDVHNIMSAAAGMPCKIVCLIICFFFAKWTLKTSPRSACHGHRLPRSSFGSETVPTVPSICTELGKSVASSADFMVMLMLCRLCFVTKDVDVILWKWLLALAKLPVFEWTEGSVDEGNSLAIGTGCKKRFSTVRMSALDSPKLQAQLVQPFSMTLEAVEAAVWTAPMPK